MKNCIVAALFLCISLCVHEGPLFAQFDSEVMGVERAIKHAVRVFETAHEVVAIRNAIDRDDIEKAYSILFDLGKSKLAQLLDIDVVEAALENLRRDMRHPLDLERLDKIETLLRQSKHHEVVPKLLRAYRRGTEIMRKGKTDGSFSYSVAKTLAQHESLQDIFLAIKGYLATDELYADPVILIFRKAQERGVEIRATAEMTEWLTRVHEADPSLYQESSPHQFQGEPTARRAFISPHFLYIYLTEINPIEQTAESEAFLTSYRKKFNTAPTPFLTPHEWTQLYFAAQRKYPESIAGLFSFPENEVYHDYFSVEDHPDKDHICAMADFIKQANRERPAALIAALKYILRRYSDISEVEIQSMDAPQFMKWLQEGKLQTFVTQMKNLKEVRHRFIEIGEVLFHMENQPIDPSWLDASQVKLGQDARLIEDILTPLELDQINQIEELRATREILSQIYGERYLPKIDILRKHLSYLKRSR